jgi:hypothetical protein
MDHISAIQEAVDEHKKDTQTELVRIVMENTQALYNIHKRLYKLTWTVVLSHAHIMAQLEHEDSVHVSLIDDTQTLLVEAVDHVPNGMRAIQMPQHGKMLASWTQLSFPKVIREHRLLQKDCLCVIHSIVPYEPINNP